MTKYGKHQLVGRALVINQNNEVLLVSHTSGEFWYTPGGRVNPGESIRSCAEREVFEETGLEVNFGNLLYVDEIIDPGLNAHKVECYFLGTTDQELPENWQDEHGPVKIAKFFDRNELKKLDRIFPDHLLGPFWTLVNRGLTGHNPYRDLSNSTCT